MSLSLALDLPNQVTNASLGLITSVEARKARSLLATDPAGLSTGDLDPQYFSLGAKIREALTNPSTYSQEELARAVVFAKGLGSYSLGADFDSGSLKWAQEVAPFFSSAVVVLFQAENFSSSFDATAGNFNSDLTPGDTGSWTSVNPDTDIVGGVVVNSTDNEWLEWNRPPELVDGTYEVVARLARGSLSNGTANLSGTTVPILSTGGWNTYVEQTLTSSFVVSNSLTAVRVTYANSFNFDWIRFTKV